MKKQILILGAFGHIGYSLSEYLCDKNYDVIATFHKSVDKQLLSKLKKKKCKNFEM